jgi:lysophospholipase L1-like esterase
MLLKNGDLLLFQGDSVTDCGRGRGEDTRLGDGYPLMIAGLLGQRHPQLQAKVVNRGISGHRVKDLAARWDEDCVRLQPDVVTLLIGINDTWRRFDSADPTSAVDYHAVYRTLLARVRGETKARLIVLMDPFVLPSPPDRIAWREDLNPRIDIVRSLSHEFDALYVPLDGLFAAAARKAPCAFWAADGVHPTPAGHALIAQAWLDAVDA